MVICYTNDSDEVFHGLTVLFGLKITSPIYVPEYCGKYLANKHQIIFGFKTVFLAENTILAYAFQRGLGIKVISLMLKNGCNQLPTEKKHMIKLVKPLYFSSVPLVEILGASSFKNFNIIQTCMNMKTVCNFFMKEEKKAFFKKPLSLQNICRIHLTNAKKQVVEDDNDLTPLMKKFLRFEI